jgi:pyruvate ferredoxin oxidoreductase gamma subunit
MYRIRFHGRGGQGIKTAGRVLGRAFFLQGYEVQDAPRYGAERRGAPIFAYVRADRQTINERGIVQQPDLVIVADDTLMALPAADVLAGINENTVLLIYSNTTGEEWRDRLNLQGVVIVIPMGQEAEDPLQRRFAGTRCAGAAARLCEVIQRDQLRQAVAEELAGLKPTIVEKNIEQALQSFDAMETNPHRVKASAGISAENFTPPKWIELPFEDARISAPSIHAAATSVNSQTGLWRTLRPIIDYDRCNQCWWVCSTFCPDGAIDVTANRYPRIDYDHCKGCMVCVSQCPPHAISAVAESEAMHHPIKEPPQ